MWEDICYDQKLHENIELKNIRNEFSLRLKYYKLRKMQLIELRLNSNCFVEIFPIEIIFLEKKYDEKYLNGPVILLEHI